MRVLALCGWDGLVLVPGAEHKSRINKGFACVWGKNFVPHTKFHFGVSRAQQGQLGKTGQNNLASLF